MSEERALKEYEDIYAKVAQQMGNIYRNSWYEFELFILKTISTLRISANLIHRLESYTNYMLSKSLNELYLDILLNLKMPPGTVIDMIQEETKNAESTNMALVHFKNLPWLMVTNPNFEIFIGNQFPNCVNVAAIIKEMCNQVIKPKVKRVPYKEWTNMLPMSNGVFDFHYQERFKHMINKKNDNNIESYLKEGLGLKTHYTLTRDSRFSIFRNYTEDDSVLAPMGYEFNYDEYIKTFDSTYLLSVYNEKRYSKQFCYYIRSLFGTNKGNFGPLQYTNMLVLFIFIAQFIMRTKILQKVVNIVGNGKYDT